MSKRLVIIPAYNEEGNIIKTVTDVQEHAPSFDYIIINDCSTDNTLRICKERGYEVLNLPCNMGIGGGVQTGYIYAQRNGYDYAVQFDGDGQHNAAYLEEMAEKMEDENLDMLIGSRYIKKEGFQSSGARRMGIKYFTGLIKLVTGTTITDPTSGMRMVGSEVIEMFAKEYPKDYPEPESVVTLLKKGKKVKELPVTMNAREEGVSSISPLKAVYYMVKVSLAILIAAVRN
ncbi:MAG: glycosyltransferase family 2 protein [Lachnospiraceae bacterium]